MACCCSESVKANSDNGHSEIAVPGTALHEGATTVTSPQTGVTEGDSR
jgi:hypothetical protein